MAGRPFFGAMIGLLAGAGIAQQRPTSIAWRRPRNPNGEPRSPERLAAAEDRRVRRNLLRLRNWCASSANYHPVARRFGVRHG